MEVGAFDVEGCHVVIGDLDAFFVGLGIEFAFDLQTGPGCGCADQFDDSLPRDQRRAAPILGDVAK